MTKVIDNVKVMNSVARTLLMIVAVGIFSYGGWLVYAYLIWPRIESQRALEKANIELQQANQQLDDARTTIGKQLQQIDQLSEENARLETANRLLKIDHRLAHVRVLEMGTDPDTKKPFTRVQFQEITEGGEVVGKSKEFRLSGREIRVDGFVVKFDDEFIEKADLHRGTSLYMFRSIYGEMDGPTNGQSLEEEWSRPAAYARGSKLSDFEKEIWDNFWTYTNNPMKRKELGIRAAHGQVNYVLAEEGKLYEVELRASDGLTIRAIDEEPSPAKPEKDDKI
jgi:hypothetical protein